MSVRKVGSSGGARESLARVGMFWTLNSIWNPVVNLYGVVSLIARQWPSVQGLHRWSVQYKAKRWPNQWVVKLFPKLVLKRKLAHHPCTTSVLSSILQPFMHVLEHTIWFITPPDGCFPIIERSGCLQVGQNGSCFKASLRQPEQNWWPHLVCLGFVNSSRQIGQFLSEGEKYMLLSKSDLHCI